MSVQPLTHSAPWMRERRVKDGNGRVLYSVFPVYAKLARSKRPVRLCTFATFEEALEYMRDRAPEVEA